MYLELIDAYSAIGEYEKAYAKQLLYAELKDSLFKEDKSKEIGKLEAKHEMERKIEDALWIRPVDVVAALNGRRYSSSGSVVFRMHDELCPWNDGVYSLVVDEKGNGRCEAAEGDAEIELTPFALGAAYLGGSHFHDLARSGHVTGKVEALKHLDAMFTWDPLPWCQEVF